MREGVKEKGGEEAGRIFSIFNFFVQLFFELFSILYDDDITANTAFLVILSTSRLLFHVTSLKIF